MKNIWIMISMLIFIICLASCEKDKSEQAVYDNTPHNLNYEGFPAPNLPQDNPLTEQGVQLGRMLFYEPALSRDGSQSCASCHIQQDGFSDSNQFSEGVQGLLGTRQAMPVFNLAWHSNDFFWDGRAELLRDQALLPIQDVLEMDETLENVITKLSNKTNYTDQFMRASVRKKLLLKRWHSPWNNS